MTLANIERLASPRAGLISGAARLSSRTGSEDWHVAAANLGDLSVVRRELAEFHPQPTRGAMNGAGTSRDLRDALRLAMAESLERYSTTVWHDLPLRWSSQGELEALGERCVDLTSLARVSETEAGRPWAALQEPDPSADIRWVQGVDLVAGEPTWVPAVCSFFYIRPECPGERIWNSISTGCAVHTDIYSALLSGLLEVVERDLISTLWLQRMVFPRIRLGSLGGEAADFVAHNEARGVSTTLVDATTDLGVPTVYGYLHRPGSARSQIVTCATASAPEDAALKVLREAMSGWVALEHSEETVDAPEAMFDVMHGAVYMGSPERAHAFDFIGSSPDERDISDLPRLPDDPELALATVVERLERIGERPVALELTTDEAARVGFRAVRVLVPGLMPLSFVGSAQFLGTPRLYELPRELGLPVRSEGELNPWPQPFA